MLCSSSRVESPLICNYRRGGIQLIRMRTPGFTRVNARGGWSMLKQHVCEIPRALEREMC
jgi:hypothetical protein